MYSGVDKSKTEFRRKWDLEEFEKKAQERLGKRKKEEEGSDHEGGDEGEEATGSDVESKGKDVNKKAKKEEKPAKPKEMLQARDYKVDLESKIGKSVVINRGAGGSAGGGYFCEVCDCTLKDSVSYLDHINGKKHQQNMGFSMKVKRSTVDDVKARLESAMSKKVEEKKAYDIDEKMKEIAEEEERVREYRREKKKGKKNKKHKRQDDDDDEDGEALDDDMAASMGFGSFGGSKK